MAIGDVFQLVRIVQIDGQEHVNVLHFNDTLGTFTDAEEELAEAWDTLNMDCPELKLRQFQLGAETYVPLTISVQKISPTKDEPFIRSLHPRSLAIGSGLPTINQISADFATARNDRSGRGRMFIGGIRDVHTDGNQLNGVGQGVFDPFIAALVEWFTENGAEFIGFVLGVWSRKLLEFNAVTGVGYATTIGSMVSRRPGRGN